MSRFQREKLTIEQVKRIRRLAENKPFDLSFKMIAKRFGVSGPTVSKIVAKRGNYSL